MSTFFVATVIMSDSSSMFGLSDFGVGCLGLVLNCAVLLLAGFFTFRAQREYLKLVKLPPGCKYHFFLSHFQKNSGDQCYTLYHALTARGFLVWFDMRMGELTEPAVKKGVEQSAVFVIFLNRNTLSREFVQRELATAMALGKTKMAFIEKDARRDAPLDETGRPERRLICFNGDGGAETPPAMIELTDALLASHMTLEYERRWPYVEAMVARFLALANTIGGINADLSLSLQRIPVPPLMVSVNILHTSPGEQQAAEIARRLTDRGVARVTTNGRASKSSVTILFLVDGFFGDGTSTNTFIVESVQHSMIHRIPLMLIFEPEKEFGAPLNAQMSFDFNKVFSEQAPEPLKKLHYDLEALSFKRGYEELKEAMIDAILAQAALALEKARPAPAIAVPSGDTEMSKADIEMAITQEPKVQPNPLHGHVI